MNSSLAKLGDLLYVAGRWEEAEGIFNQLASVDEDAVDNKGYLGCLAARRGNFDRARMIDAELEAAVRQQVLGGVRARSRKAEQGQRRQQRACDSRQETADHVRHPFKKTRFAPSLFPGRRRSKTCRAAAYPPFAMARR